MGKSKFEPVLEHEDSNNTDKVKIDSRHLELHKLFIHFNSTGKALKGGIEPLKQEFFERLAIEIH